METRVDIRKAVLPAIFALACTVLTLLAVRVFGGALPFQAKGYELTVPLPDATNLVAGSEVQIAGVPIGQVAKVQRSGSAADAVLEIEPRYAPLHAGATAIVRTKTLLGEGYIEIAPGPPSAPALPEGGYLPPANVKRTVQLDQFLSTFSAATRRRLRGLLGGMARGFAGRSLDVSASLAYSQPLTADLSTLLHAVERQRGDLRDLLAHGASVLTAVGRRQGFVQADVRAGRRVLSATARRNRALSATVRALPGFLFRLRAASRTIAAASPELTAAVQALLPSAPLVRPALEAIDTAAPQFRSLFRHLPALLEAGRKGLPNVRPITASARHGFHRFYPTSRELIPFMQLFGVDRNSLKILANVAAVDAGSYVRTDGKVIGYATGLATIWNETISGWKKKLPTNRQNPYPKPPNGLLDTGRIGVLKSYDCRHVHNPLYLPPTGTGAPPCILQGPWTFDGRSAFYPRLYKAPP